MDPVDVVASATSRPFSRSTMSESLPNNKSTKLSLEVESASYLYLGSMETSASSDSKGDVIVRRRRRRQRRLADDGEIIVHRASPSTIPEHQSIHHAHFESDKLSLSAANTLDTALISTMTPETPDWVGTVASAPTTGSAPSPSESIRIPSQTTFSRSRRLKMSKSKDLTSRPKPVLRKHSTAPESCVQPKQTDVLDNVLMDRAFSIRQRLINFEMQELAEEAEKAAESGLEKFVGSASKFGASLSCLR
jgi:hypothetical protein